MAKRTIAMGNEAIADSLRAQEIQFRVTTGSGGKRIFVVEFYPFLETELFRLLEIDELHLDGLRRLRQQIEAKEPNHSWLSRRRFNGHGRKT
jgi:hypothetical protein